MFLRTILLVILGDYRLTKLPVYNGFKNNLNV
jgi:hypothetical protein